MQLMRKEAEKLKGHSLQETEAAIPGKDSNLELELSEQQSTELADATGIIKKKFGKELSELLVETSQSCGEDFVKLCQDGWEEDQRRNVTGSKGNRWNVLTYRIALAIFARCPAAYEAVMDFGIIQLPSRRQLMRKMTDQFGSGQGSCEQFIESQRKLYDASQKGKALAGKSTGILIFDECKTVAKLCWNSRNHEIYGAAVGFEDFK